MLKYSDFLLEEKINLISESILYFSPRFRNKLKKVKDEVSKSLLDLEFQNLKDDITLIDIDDKEGYITFTTSKDALKNLEKDYPQKLYPWVHGMFDKDIQSGNVTHFFDKNIDVVTKSRNPLRIGRFINKMLPGKFTNKQIEDFINKFKATEVQQGERFIVVSGDEIADWYGSEKYLQNSGTLGTSCMKVVDKSYFEIYTKNPEVCRMLCLIEEDSNGDEKLKARALVWNVEFTSEYVHEKFEFFMDRQYAISDSLIEKMKNYAKEQGWAYKTNNNHYDYNLVTFNDKEYSLNMKVQLNHLEYKKFPYVDTFRRYVPDMFTIFNDDNEDEDGDYLLDQTDGTYTEIGNKTVFSEWHDREIIQDDAVWSEYLQDYIYRENSVEVNIGTQRRRGFYPDDYDEIVYDEQRGEYIHIDDAVYSDYYNHNIYVDDAVSVVCEINNNGECNSDSYYLSDNDRNWVPFSHIDDYAWYQNMRDKNNNWENHQGILKSLLERDEEEDWIPTKFKIEVFKMKEPVRKLTWLTKIDAEILDIEIDENESKTSDAWSYTDDLNENNLISRLRFAIENKLNPKQLRLDFGDEFSENPMVETLEKRLEQIDKFLVD